MAARVRITTCYYASLCYHAARSLGLLDTPADPELAEEARRLSPLATAFVTRPPTTTGPHLPLIYHLPASLDPRTPEELADIAALICAGVREGSLDERARDWPGARFLWTYDAAIAQHYAGEEEQTCQLLAGFFDVLGRLWSPYLFSYQALLSDYPFEANERRSCGLNAIARWEAEFGQTYPYDEFTVVVCPESPWKAMSIRRDRILFSARHDWEMLRQAVIHEVGIRIPGMDRLWDHPATGPLLAQDPEGFITLCEAETCFRKPHVFPDLGTDDFLEGMELQALVELRTELGRGADVYDDYARWYAAAVDRGMLPVTMPENAAA